MLYRTFFKRLLAVTLLSASTASFAHPALSTHSMNVDGLGPVKIGMTPQQASVKLGIVLSRAREPDENDIYCHYVYPGGDYRDIGFMVVRGEIVRIDVFSSLIGVDGKIFVGSDESIIDKTYPGLVEEETHPYLGISGKYLTIKKISGFTYLFETDSGKISRFRMGRERPVKLIEGCH